MASSVHLSRSLHRPTCPHPLTSVHGHTPPRTQRCQAWPEWVRGFLDFSSWAPKSTRIWRLQEYEYPESKPDEVDELQAKINKLTSSTSSPSPTRDGGSAEPSPSPATSLQKEDLPVVEDLPASGSFWDAGDSELAKALSSRIQAINSGSVEVEDEEEEEEGSGPVVVEPALTGEEMKSLLMVKYGKTYDCSLVRRDIPGKAFVSLNIMWQHLEQRSFRLTEEQYDEKIASIAYLLNVLGQTKKIRSFLQAPARSQRGLPRRPVVGTAISIQLDLEPDLIEEFFGAGYQ